RADQQVPMRPDADEGQLGAPGVDAEDEAGGAVNGEQAFGACAGSRSGSDHVEHGFQRDAGTVAPQPLTILARFRRQPEAEGAEVVLRVVHGGLGDRHAVTPVHCSRGDTEIVDGDGRGGGEREQKCQECDGATGFHFRPSPTSGISMPEMRSEAEGSPPSGFRMLISPSVSMTTALTSATSWTPCWRSAASSSTSAMRSRFMLSRSSWPS